jgi:integrase
VKGHTYKRCPCGPVRDEDGRRINCPKKHGSWYYKHELPPTAGGRRRQATRGGFATEKEARRALTQALEKVNRGGYVAPTRLKVGEYLDQWLAGKAALRANTRRSYISHVELYLRPGIGHLRLVDLRETDIERLYVLVRLLGQPEPAPRSPELERLVAVRKEGVQIRPVGPASLNRLHATLLSALNSAVKRKLLPDNPATHGELPTARRPKAVVWTEERVAAWRRTRVRPPVAVWTPEQTGAFLDAALQDRLYPIYHLIAYRGLRRGEAVGLRWEDLDVAGQQIVVSQQVVQLGWETEIGAPKTDSGTRIVPLDGGTLAVLQAWRHLQQAEAEAWGSAWQQTGLVFTREDGSGLHPDLVTDTFHRIAATADLPPIRLHDLRHTAASLALQAGVPMKVVSEQLGHSSLAITADTYTSVLPAVAHAAAEAVANTVPRRSSKAKPASENGDTAAPLPVRSHADSEEGSVNRETDVDEANDQVRGGAPSGTRTPNPLIKSQLLCLLS